MRIVIKDMDDARSRKPFDRPEPLWSVGAPESPEDEAVIAEYDAASPPANGEIMHVRWMHPDHQGHIDTRWRVMGTRWEVIEYPANHVRHMNPTVRAVVLAVCLEAEKLPKPGEGVAA